MTVCGLSASSSVPCAFVWPSISSARSEASLQDSSLRAKSNQFRLVCERVRPLECLPKLFNYGCIMPHVCKKYLIPIDQQASDARDALRATGACGMPKYWRSMTTNSIARIWPLQSDGFARLSGTCSLVLLHRSEDSPGNVLFCSRLACAGT